MEAEPMQGMNDLGSRRYNVPMCANYRPTSRDLLEQRFQVAAPDSNYAPEAFPADMAPLIRKPGTNATQGDRAAVLAMFGIAPGWANDPKKLARSTYNARSETVAEKPSFRAAFKHGQFCIIPAASIYEPSYESGQAVRWEITDADGAPLAIAGIWDVKQDGPDGLPLISFSMLTINADEHPLMNRFHKPGDEKRMVVMLRPEQIDDWLHCEPQQASLFLEPYPAQRLNAKPAPLTRKSAPRREPPPDPQESLF